MFDKNTSFSTLRELLAENRFLSDLISAFWVNNLLDVEILRSDIDNSGYDIAVGYNEKVLYIQLKTKLVGGKTIEAPINIKLTNKENYAIVLMEIIEAPEHNSVNIKYYWWHNKNEKAIDVFSDDKISKHTKANASGQKKERPNIRKVKYKEFDPIDIISIVEYFCKK
jgi:hypothetical protein